MRLAVSVLLAFMTGFVYEVAEQAQFVPDAPPRLSLLRVSTPTPEAEVTITGLPGAVIANSAVVMINLDTGHFATAQAAADGGFSQSVFAPPGASVLLKADPTSDIIRYIQNCRPPQCAINLPQYAGAILHITPATATTAGLSFAGAGLVEDASSPVWTFQGSVYSSELPLGGMLTATGTLVIVSSALQNSGTMRVRAWLSLERLTGPDGAGAMQEHFFASTLLTPTGLPIERLPSVSGGLEQQQRFDLAKTRLDRAEARVEMSLGLPADLLAGYYRPFITFVFEGVPAEVTGARTLAQISLHRRPRGLYLPVLRAGNPAPPRLLWTLLTDTLSNGTRGARAIEDQNRFGVASRVVTQSEQFIIPRAHPITGRPISYRLEPFALTESVGDRGMPPNSPRIPFRFPSGRLTVRLQKPDGSAEVNGPAPFAQARMRGLYDRDGVPLMDGGGQLTDAYQLSTLDPRFEVQFAQEGRYVITLEGVIEDIWGNVWNGGGTYEVWVARSLSLDTAVLPGTPFEVGDLFAPGLVITPALPALIDVRFQLAVNSDPRRMIERTVRGFANRFGYFSAAGKAIVLDSPGEYRVDVTASFRDPQGNLRMGSRTWGGVVAPRNPQLIAHGRRGIDQQPTIGPQWFFRTQLGVPTGGTHVHFPFHSGDVMWLQKSDSVVPHITFQDPIGSVANLIRSRYFWGHPERFAVGEVPLFSSRPDNVDPHLDPARVDLWGYAYSVVQRPLVRVREEIAEDAGALLSLYWRFNEPYAAQVGAGRSGDLPNDIKFQYGAAVLRGAALPGPQYAIYGSTFVLVPDDDPGSGTRVFPPFQGNGGGPGGGPVMKLNGRFFVYVVPRDSPLLTVNLPETMTIAAPGQLDITARPPAGQNLTSGHVSTMMPGFLLQANQLSASAGALSYRYDPVTLARDFPNLDLNPPADVITISLFGQTANSSYAARVLVLHGQEFFNLAPTRAPTRAVASVSAASFSGATLASESIVAAFGTGLAITTQTAATVPLPTSLAGTTISVKDSAGTERLAPLFFVSPGQINYQMPPGTMTGAATVTMTNRYGERSPLAWCRLRRLPQGSLRSMPTGKAWRRPWPCG